MAAAESYPDDLRYHSEHDWARLEDGEAVFGITWFAQDALGELVHFEPESPQPLLDVCFADPSRGVAVGAYGVIYVTTDGGAVWSQVPFEPEPLPGAETVTPAEDEMETEIDLGFEFHLNAIARGPGHRMYLGAEAGRLFRSDDDGAHWRESSRDHCASPHRPLPAAIRPGGIST